VKLGRIIKVVHTLGAIGIMGGVAACVVLRLHGPGPGAEGWLVVRHQLNALFRYLLVPSTGVCIFSGFLSMFVYKPFWDALWAWAKAGSGVILLQFTFRLKWNALDVTAPLDPSDPLDLSKALRNEWSGFWVLLGVSLFNVVVGVWRPRFRVR